MKVTLVVPCYNEEKNVALFYEVAEAAFQNKKIEYDIVFVNDGSKDNTYKELKALFTAHPDKVSVINLSRNFGKEAAILAGLKRASGDYVLISLSPVPIPSFALISWRKLPSVCPGSPSCFMALLLCPRSM